MLIAGIHINLIFFYTTFNWMIHPEADDGYLI